MNREAKPMSSLDASAPDSTLKLPTVENGFPPNRYLGRYVIEQSIGVGGMGEVYRAQDTRLELSVAIKVLPRETSKNSSLRRRFLNEARAASAARALELEPNGVLNHLLAPVAVLYAGRMEEARVAIDRARRRFPAESFGLGVESVFAALEGDALRAEVLADEAARSNHSMTLTHHTWHSCAATYALIGKSGKAIHELERCADMGLPSYRLFGSDPYLRSLHYDPRFVELMTRLRREHDEIRNKFAIDA